MPIVESGLISEDRERGSVADLAITPIPTASSTDLHHVDAAYVAWKSGQTGAATFDLYTRSNPFGGDADEGDSPRIELAGDADESTWPGQKAAYRVGDFDHDLIQLEAEPEPPDGRRLLQPVFEGGHLVAKAPSIMAVPGHLRELTVTEPYDVRMSDATQSLRAETIARLAEARID